MDSPASEADPIVTYLSWSKVKGMYVGLKQLSKLINNIIGIRLVLSLVRITLLYAVALDNMVDWTDVLHTFVGLMESTTFLMVSADVIRQVKIQGTDNLHY